MIKKLRRKFVAICMILVTLILAVVFCSLYVTMERNIENLSHQVLRRVIQEDTPLPPVGGAPEFGMDFGGDRVVLPYFTVHLWGDTAYVTGGTYANLEDTQELQSILNECLSMPEKEGELTGYRLRYLRQENGLYQKIAFVDMSMEVSILRNMMGPYILVIALSLTLLLFVAILLSRWATRPVEKAWAQQKQFLSDASHELKTPLTVILSNAELLDAAPLEDRPARWTDNIHSEATRMKALVEEMLTLARADNMTHAAPFETVSLSEVAYGCALAFEPVAFENGKTLEYQITEDAVVFGDQEKLRQLLSILLDNAIKYGAPGGTISVLLQKADRHLSLTVSNPGDPIPPEQLSHLFERFYRADASRGEQTGFGLGLSIAASIAQEHQGSLRAESDERSTRFIFTMPLKK